MNSTTINRLTWVDINKGLAIFLVALGHCTSGGFQAFIYTFHMPFFFFIAGYLLNFDKWGNNFTAFIKSRFRRLIIPYIIGEVLYTLVWLFYDIARRHTWDWNNSKVVLGIFYGNGINGWLVLADLWFLPCLFFSELIFLFLISKIGNKYLVLAISCLLSFAGYIISFYLILPWEIDVAFFAQFFVMVGYYCRRYSLLAKVSNMLIPILIILCVISWHINGRIDLNTRIYHEVLFLYLGAIAGCFLLMKIAFMIDSKNYSFNKVLEFWGKQSLIILLFHHYIEISIAHVFVYLEPNLKHGLVYFNPLYILVALFFGMLIPSVIAKYFDKYPVIRIFSASR